MFCNNLGKTVSGNRYHAVSNDTSILCNRNIRSSRANIYQRDVQHSVHFRYRHLNCGDRLQCQIHHLKSCRTDSLVKSIHNIFRQKGGNDILSNGFRLVPFQVSYHISVHIIVYDRIPYTVEFHIQIIFFLKFLIGLLYSHGIQRVDIFSRHFLVCLKFIVHSGRHCTQHSSCRRNANLFQRYGKSALQLCLDLSDGLSNLINIVNLSIQHGPCLMLPDALTCHIELISDTVPYRSHDTSRSDIKPKY